MRNILITLLLLTITVSLSEPLVAQGIDTDRGYPPSYPEPYTPYPTPGMIKEPFGDRLNYEINHSAFFADVSAAGFSDTANGDTLIYYGHVISTAQADSWPRLFFTGVDSAVLMKIEYRYVSRAGDAFAYGGWQEYAGANRIMYTKRFYTPGLGGGRDTVIAIPDPGSAAVGGYENLDWNKQRSPYIQFKYYVRSWRALDASKPGGKSCFVKPEGPMNYHWRGQMILVFERKYI